MNEIQSQRREEDGTDQGSGVGALLRASRQRIGEDLRDIAHMLHIRYRYLEAIEDGRYADLPGPAYAIGFIRAYAQNLGLDSDEVVRRFKAETSGFDDKPNLDFLSPIPEGGIPGGALLFVGALVAILAYGGWYVSTSNNRFFAETVPPLPDRLSALLPDGQGVGDTVQPSPATATAAPVAGDADGRAVAGSAAGGAIEPTADGETNAAGDAAGRSVDGADPAPGAEQPPSGEAAAALSPTEDAPSAADAPDRSVSAGTAALAPVLPPAQEAAARPAAESAVPPTTESAASPPTEPAASAATETAPSPSTEPAASPATERAQEPAVENPAASPAASTVSPPTEGAGPPAAAPPATRSAAASPATAPTADGSSVWEFAASRRAGAAPPEGDAGRQVAAAALGPPATPGASRITIRAKSASWIQVRDDVGERPLQTRLLRPGNDYRVPDRPGLRLSTGNAGAIEILVDGEVVPSIGPIGQVRRDVALDIERLRRGTAAGD